MRYDMLQVISNKAGDIDMVLRYNGVYILKAKGSILADWINYFVAQKGFDYNGFSFN